MEFGIGRVVDSVELSCEFLIIRMCVCSIWSIGLEEQEQDDSTVIHLGC